MKETKKDGPKRKRNSRSSRNSRQVVAMTGVVLLVLLYIATLVTAIVDSSQSAKWFRICLFATFALPLVIWIYSWMHGRLTGKSAIGDPEVPNPAQASPSIEIQDSAAGDVPSENADGTAGD